MKTIKGAIFDMDGTVFDSEKISFNVWQNVLNKYGYKIDIIKYTSLMGRKHDAVDKLLMELYGKDFPLKKIRSEKDSAMLKYIYENEVPLKKGIKALFKFLHECNCMTALATSSKKDRIDGLFKKANIRKEEFDVLVCGEEVSKSKPDPEIFLKAAEKLDISPENCIVFEDSPVGIEAAYKGGIWGINIPDLKKPDDDIKRFAYKIFPDMNEAKEYLAMHICGSEDDAQIILKI